MPDVNAWLGNPMTIDRNATRASAAWQRISDKPTSVVFTRGAVDLSAQTVRVEFNSGGSDATGPVSDGGVQGVVVFGVKDHPLEADTDMQRGDRFWHDDQEYEITVVINLTGQSANP